MESIQLSLNHNLDIVFFIYGLAFVSMGIAVLVQPKKGSEFKIANILWLLGAFGITHGLNELLDMWTIIKGRNPALDIVRWFILIISYLALFEFGRQLFNLSMIKASSPKGKFNGLLGWWLFPLIGSVILFFGFASSDFWKIGSIWTRYLLGLPGGLLIGLGFFKYYSTEEKTLQQLKIKKYFSSAGAVFILYGILSGLVVPKGNFFPSNWLNTDSFLLALKMPVQVFRTGCAIVAIWAVGGMLNIFNWEIRTRLQKAQVMLKQQLRESEERYLEIVESSSDIIHSIDTDDLIICSNSSGCSSLGYSQGELIGKHIKELYAPETWAELEKLFQKVRREGSVFLDEGKIVKKNGSHLDVAVHLMTMYDDKKSFLGSRLITRNITERKRAEEALRESEERYRLLFKESRDAIYITEQNGQFIDINQSALDLLGYTREEVLKLNVHDLNSNPDDRYIFQKTMEEKGFVRDFASKFCKKDGTEIDCLLTSTVRRDNSGNILGYQGIIRDITERKKRVEEQLKLEKLESVGILAGGIAHDFNNILTSIVGNIALTKMSVSPEENTFEILTDAEKACLRAKDLTKQLLTFSKGGIPIKKLTSIKEILTDSANFSLRGSNIRYTLTIPDNVWPVEIDEGQISQVFNNLVINAKQTMPEGGAVRIYVHNIPTEEVTNMPLHKGDYLKITIQDEGIGIPEEHLKKIFDPYFTTKQSGSGLGLTTSYSIIKNHGGYIHVGSEVGVGTTFYIHLPASSTVITKKDGKKHTISRGKGKVLLMEDEDAIQKTVAKVLRQIGYEVEITKNGTETIALYQKARESVQPFEVVLMDLTIRGGMGGKETIKKLREIDPEVKAIVSSGYFNDPIMADYKKYGFSGVISKPYEIEELSSILNSIIEDNN
jgi:PAS domain S-box-containing protein